MDSYDRLWRLPQSLQIYNGGNLKKQKTGENERMTSFNVTEWNVIFFFPGILLGLRLESGEAKHLWGESILNRINSRWNVTTAQHLRFNGGFQTASCLFLKLLRAATQINIPITLELFINYINLTERTTIGWRISNQEGPKTLRSLLNWRDHATTEHY